MLRDATREQLSRERGKSVWAAFVKNHAKENKPAFFVDARTPCQIQLTFAGTNDCTTGQAHKDGDGGVLVG